MFFDQSTLTIARKLLGCRLIHYVPGVGEVVVKIVETEAYRQDDPACHAHIQWQRRKRGLPAVGRSALLFGPPGVAYVYLNYGIHWLFNVVTEREGKAGAVLVRAVEPMKGLDYIKANRPQMAVLQSTNGPGKLTQALGIDQRFNGHPLNEHPLKLELVKEQHSIVVRPRIGISKAADLPWRFYIKDNPYVSKL